MAKKIKIDVDFTQDNTILAISCHKKDYWLAYRMNEIPGLKFRRIKDLPYYHSRLETMIHYSLFYCENAEQQLTFYLLSNFSPEGKLFPDHKSTDFFILINGNLIDEYKKKLIAEIKKINGVLVVYEPGLDDIRDFDNFLSDLELHMIDILKSSVK